MKRVPSFILCLILTAGALVAADKAGRTVVSSTEPDYPAIAAKLSLHGVVKLKAWIAPDGTVRRLEYVGGHPLLAESALKAVKLWKFQPAAAESNQVVEVKF